MTKKHWRTLRKFLLFIAVVAIVVIAVEIHRLATVVTMTVEMGLPMFIPR